MSAFVQQLYTGGLISGYKIGKDSINIEKIRVQEHNKNFDAYIRIDTLEILFLKHKFKFSYYIIPKCRCGNKPYWYDGVVYCETCEKAGSEFIFGIV